MTAQNQRVFIMSKEAIKERIKKNQKGECALTGNKLKADISLMDTDRIDPKANGGIYVDENTRVVDPIAHMIRHGTFREREKQLDELKTMVDGREQVRKLLNSTNNRILAMKRRTDILDEKTLAWLSGQAKETQSELGKIDRGIGKHLKKMDHPIIKSALGIKGLGPNTIAYMMVYIDITKAKYASSLWAYCGYDKPSHERYEKNVASGGNKILRTVLYTMADSMIKTRSIYRDVYDSSKKQREVSKKITKSWNTQGKLIECAWCDTKPCHRHGDAMRKMIKHFLADWWFVHRTLEGLSTAPLYVEEKLGHTGIVKPKERGWIY
ncbi:hypothetical protein ES705_19844 [subsurface metagenome]